MQLYELAEMRTAAAVLLGVSSVVLVFGALIFHDGMDIRIPMPQ